MRYDPTRFDVSSVEDAERVILTPECGFTTAERWKDEAPYLMSLIDQYLKISPNKVILDYGCGIGRMSKPLVHMRECRVIGVDISANMRALATSIISDDRFVAIAPSQIDMMYHSYHKCCDAAISIWTLQHCLHPKEDCLKIKNALRHTARLLVVNNERRVVPVEGGQWMDDGLDLRNILKIEFDEIAYGKLDSNVVAGISEWTFWGVYSAR